MDIIQKPEGHKQITKKLCKCNKKMAMLPIYVYKTCVLKIQNINEIEHTGVIVRVTSEVRWREDWKCGEL